MKLDKRKQVRPLHDVFKMIDMRGGDKSQCWPWQGTLAPNPIFCWNNSRLQAHRVVYALRHGIPLEKVPRLSWTCNNRSCCNPYHLEERYNINRKLTKV